MDSKDKRGISAGIVNGDGKVNAPKLLMLLVYITAAAAFLPIALFADPELTSGFLFGAISSAVAVVGIAVLILVAGTARPVLWFCILSAVILFFGGVPQIAGIFVSFITSVSLFAFVINEIRSPLIYIVAPAAYFAAYAVLGDFVLPSLALLFLPASVVLAVSVRRGAARVGAVCRVSAAFACFVLLFISARMFMKYGLLGFDDIRAYIESLKTYLTELVADRVMNTASVIGYDISRADALELFGSLITSIFNILPALFIVSCNIAAFAVHSLYVTMLVCIGEDKAITIRALSFRMSVTSAVVFIVAFFVNAFMSSDKNYLVAASAENIAIVLQPGLTVIAFAFINALAARKQISCFGALLYVMFFAMFLYIPYAMLSLSSFCGAVIIIVSAIRERRAGKGARP